MSFRTLIFAIPYSVFQGFSIFQSIASNTLPELQHNSQTAPKWFQDTPKILPRASQDPSWSRLGRQLRSLGALLGALGRSWPLLGRSWDALGTLLGRCWSLLAALGRPRDPLGTFLARFRTSITRFWTLRSYVKRLLSNPSARLAARYLHNSCTMSCKKPRSHSEQPKRTNSL